VCTAMRREVRKVHARSGFTCDFFFHMIMKGLKAPDLEQVPYSDLDNVAVVVSIVARHFTLLLVSGYAYERVR
jgi:hypothetical protein